MPTKLKRSKPAARPRTPSRRGVKVPKTYRLDARTITAAQEILGAATATETIETALDMVVFRQELVEGTRAMLGTRLRSPRG